MPENQDSRIDIRVPIKSALGFNILEDADAYMRTLSPVSAMFKKPESGLELNENDPLEAFLIQMDRKLNYLVGLLSEKIGRKDYRHQGRVTDISATGLSITAAKKITQGAFLEIGLMLPNQPQRIMDIAAKVLWAKSKTDQDTKKVKYQLGLKFIDILPEDQDTIVHYIFQKQREDIRSLKTEP